MSSPPEEIQVVCPRCDLIYRDWRRASMNLTLDPFDEEYIESATSSTCPECGHTVRHESIVVMDDDGTIVLVVSEGGTEPERERERVIFESLYWQVSEASKRGD